MMSNLNPKWLIIPLSLLVGVYGYWLQESQFLNSGGLAQVGSASGIPISLTLVGSYDSPLYPNQDIMPLVNGSRIDVMRTGSLLSIIARTTPVTGVGSMKFELPWQGRVHYEIDGRPPWAIVSHRDINSPYNYYPMSAPEGTHTLTVRAYSGPDGTGVELGFTRVTFTVLGGNAEPIVVVEPVELPQTSAYTLTVNGQAVPVRRHPSALVDGRLISFASFTFAGQAEVTVTANAPITTYQLSPQAYQIPSTVNGNSISLHLDRPQQLVLRKVNGIEEELFLFAEAPEVNPPAALGQGIFNLQAYGAVPNGSTDATVAIQQAIDAAHVYPGSQPGIVYVPSGTYSVQHSIKLKSNVHFYLSPDAVLDFNNPDRNYASGYLAGTAIWIKDADNVKIYGRGLLLGHVSSGFHVLVQSSNTNNLILEDITLLDGPTTLLRLGQVRNSRLSNLKILPTTIGDQQIYNGLSDAIDFDGATNVVLENSFLFSSDDNIAVGSGADQLAFEVPADTDNLAIRGNVQYQTQGGHVLVISTHLPRDNGRINNVTLENIQVISAHAGFGVLPSQGYVGATNITFRNIQIEEIRSHLLAFASMDFNRYAGGSANGHNNCYSGYADNVQLHNISVNNAPPAPQHPLAISQIFGRGPEVGSSCAESRPRTIRNIRFDNLRIAGRLVNSPAAIPLAIGDYTENITFND